MQISIACVTTPIGVLRLYMGAQGAVGLILPTVDWKEREERLRASLEHRVAPLDPLREGNATLEGAVQQLEEYFGGKRRSFTLALDPPGTSFQRQVWDVVCSIPFGAVCTYSQVARRIKQGLGARAVGAALAANPLPLLIPCHRVIGQDGRLVGYSGGLALKAWLLAHERHWSGSESSKCSTGLPDRSAGRRD